jgi:glycosyltransferase involved in cell wall biosynthesis
MMFAAVRRKAAAVIAISEFTKNEYLRFTGTSRQPVHAIPLGVDQSWFSVSKEPIRQRPYLLFVGNVKPHKNLSRLIEAFHLVKDEIALDLVIVGKKEGFITGDSGSLAYAGSLGGRIDFTGTVNDDTLKRLVGGARLFVFPSLYEGFGLPPLEAMAAGCPVLTSSAASLPEVCGNAAEYFDPYNVKELAAKILFLLSDQTRREWLITKGKERARQFNWINCQRETCKIILGLLKDDSR